MMWKGLKSTKEWILKCYQLNSKSRPAATELNTPCHGHGRCCSREVAASSSSGRLSSSYEPPCFYHEEERHDAGAESCLARIQDPSEWYRVIYPNKKFKRGQRSSCGFFDCLGYGYFVAAGLRLSRNGYFCSDTRNDKENRPCWNALKDALLVLAFGGRSQFSRHRLSVLPIASTVQLTSSSNVDETNQMDYCQNPDASCPLLEHHLDQLRELTNQYTAITLNCDALRLMEEKQWNQAIEYLTEASQLGLDVAMFNLGVCHERGHGVERDLTKACKCYRQAAELGHATAVYNLAVNLLEGRGVPVNEEEGLKWMEMASNSGVKEAQTFWGLRCGQNGDYQKAFTLFQMAADQEHADGEYFLGLCYENGLGVEMDLQTAAGLYEKSAGVGNADACYALAFFYENGMGGLPRCNKAAVKFYHKAASTGHPLATKRLEWSLQDTDTNELSVATTKPIGLRTVSSLPDLSPYRKDNSLMPKIENSSSMFDFTCLKEALLGYWKIDSKPFKDEHKENDDAKENCGLLSNESLNAKTILA